MRGVMACWNISGVLASVVEYSICLNPIVRPSEIMQGKEGGWVVEEASHAVKCWLNVTCNVLTLHLPLTSIPKHCLVVGYADDNTLLTTIPHAQG